MEEQKMYSLPTKGRLRGEKEWKATNEGERKATRKKVFMTMIND
jgi:hypothetical protein